MKAYVLGALLLIASVASANSQRARQLPSRDYTYGCIALSNADMERFWEQISVPTPIEIVP